MMKIIQQSSKNMFCICALILSALLLISGCGGDTGVQGFTITSMQDTGGAPTVGASVCYQVLQFKVTDSDDNAVNGIQVELNSNGLIAKHTVGNSSCENAAASTSNGVVLYTENDGTVSVEFLYTAAATGDIGFIHATSGAATPAEWETDAAP